MRTPLAILTLLTLLVAGCGSSANAPTTTTVPPPADISGTYLFNFGTSQSGALAIASLTVTLKQTQWLNGINTLTITSGQLLLGCIGPAPSNQQLSIAAHLEWNGQQEKLVLSVDSSSGNVLVMTDDNFVAPFSGTWTPGAAFSPCGNPLTAPFSWTGIKQ
jgi:hypothetical protein